MIVKTLLNIYHVRIHNYHSIVSNVLEFNSTGVREQVRDRVEDTHVYLKDRLYITNFYACFLSVKVFLKLKMLLVVPNLP